MTNENHKTQENVPVSKVRPKANRHLKKFKSYKRLSNRRTSLIIVVLVVAIAGAHYLFGSHALSPYVSLEAENGLVVSPAVTYSDTSASAGKAVQFGSAPNAVNPVEGVYDQSDPGNSTWHGFDDFNTWLGADGDNGIQTYGGVVSAGNWLPEYDTNYQIAHPGSIVEISLGTFDRCTNCSEPGPTANDVAFMAQGAAGDYNADYVNFAQALVNSGADTSNVIIRPMYECNGNWNASTAIGDETNYKNYFIQIVNSMRSVAPNLKFDWNCGGGPTFSDGQPLINAFPGAQYVNYIGDDPYDHTHSGVETPAIHEQDWTDIYGSVANGGLAWDTNFAKTESTPGHPLYVSLDEWGVWDNSSSTFGQGDDPYYIQQMFDYIYNPSNDVAASFYQNVNEGDGNHALYTIPPSNPVEFPQSASEYKSLFSTEPAGALP